VLERRYDAGLLATPCWISVSCNPALGNYESVALPLSYPGVRDFPRTCEQNGNDFTTMGGFVG